MAAITTRSGKGSALTNAEVDANFTNLNTDKAEKAITISAGTGLTGGGDLSANRTLGLANSGVSAGTYGGNNSIPTFTVDAQGRITVASTVTPSGTWGISISGNAATATNSTQLGGVAATDYFRVDGSYVNADMNTPVEGYWHVSSSATGLPEAQFGHRWDYDHTGSGQWVAQMFSPTGAGSDAGLWFRQRRDYTWQPWRKMLDSINYNSYAPTLTGGNASGTWGISITGDCSGTSKLLGYSASGQGISVGGQGGPQVSSQGGGAAMMSFHRPGAYAINFGLGTDNQLRTGGWSRGGDHVILDSGNYSGYCNFGGNSVYGGIFYDANNTGYYADPSWYSRFYRIIVGEGGTTSWINMLDDESANGTKYVHCNGGRIGFVTGHGGWAINCDDSANFWAFGSTRSPIYYDENNTGYYVDPAGTSRMNGATLGNGAETLIKLLDDESVNGQKYLHANSGTVGFLNGNGSWVNRTDDNGNLTIAGGLSQYSDERFKTDWQPISDDLIEKLATVKHGTYARTDQPIPQRYVGVSAQDMQRIVAEFVAEDENGYLSLGYGNAALIACVKLAQRVLELEARLNALNN